CLNLLEDFVAGVVCGVEYVTWFDTGVLRIQIVGTGRAGAKRCDRVRILMAGEVGFNHASAVVRGVADFDVLRIPARRLPQIFVTSKASLKSWVSNFLNRGDRGSDLLARRRSSLQGSFCVRLACDEF